MECASPATPMMVAAGSERGKPRPTTSGEPYIAMRKSAADDHGGVRIVARPERAPEQDGNLHRGEERGLDVIRDHFQSWRVVDSVSLTRVRRAAAPGRSQARRLPGAGPRAPSRCSNKRWTARRRSRIDRGLVAGRRRAHTRSQDRSRGRVGAFWSSSPRARGSGSCRRLARPS